jgi:hypothetical protein
MGTTLTGSFVSETYDALIKVTDNNIITSTLKRFTDGLGNDLPMLASNTSIQFDGNLLTESIQFNTSTSQNADAVGKLVWNDQDGTLDLRLKGNNVTLQIGQESVIRVVNKTGASLNESAYQVVRISSAQGQRLGVVLAQANNDPNSADTIGLVTETIANNQAGFITTSGIIRGINTTGSLQGETWVDGDVLYLSGTTAGAITNVKPSAPTHTVILGYVVYAHGTQGKIFVKVDNGYELNELHNVSITSPTNNQVLAYDSASGLWKNSSNGNGTVTSVALTTPTGLTISGSPITSSGTLAIGLQSGYSIPTTSSQTNWDTAFNKRLSSASLSSTTLTLTLADTTTITASVPTFNQNTTGSAATLTTTRTIWGQNFNGSANVSGALSGATTITASGAITGGSFVKSGGVATEILAADGSVITAGTNITISGGTISASGGGGISGLTTNRIIKATSSSTIGNSLLFDNGTNVLVDTVTDNSSGAKLQVNGGTTTTWIELPASSGTRSPIKLNTTGASLELTPTAGDIEVDGNAILYGNTGGTNFRGIIPIEQFLIQESSRTLVSTTGGQPLFGGTTPASINLKGGTTYFFECLIHLTGMSTTAGNCGFNLIGSGTATFTSSNFYSNGYDGSTLTSPGGMGGIFTTASSNSGNIVPSGAGTGLAVMIRGVIRVNAGGTITPTINLTTAAAATVNANTYFRCYPVGSSLVVAPGIESI